MGIIDNLFTQGCCSLRYVKTLIFVLNFSVPPEWLIEPKDASVVAGQTVALHCQADGLPVPTVIWRKGHGNYILYSV